MVEVSFHNTKRKRQSILFHIGLFFPQGCCPGNEDSVKNVLRSIFASMSDQESDQYTSVNKGPRPYRGGFTACIHWDMM